MIGHASLVVSEDALKILEARTGASTRTPAGKTEEAKS